MVPVPTGVSRTFLTKFLENQKSSNKLQFIQIVIAVLSSCNFQQHRQLEDNESALFYHGAFEPSFTFFCYRSSCPLGVLLFGAMWSYHRKPDSRTIQKQPPTTIWIKRLVDSSEPTFARSSWWRWSRKRKLQGSRGMFGKFDLVSTFLWLHTLFDRTGPPFWQFFL